jgi:perosamine synthetase
LYVVKVRGDRQAIFHALRARGIGVNVHYIPVYLHPFYRHRMGTAPGLCPNAEAAYESILSLPMFPAMSDDDVQRVADALLELTASA